MQASAIITLFLASCASARVIPAFLLSSSAKIGVIARHAADDSIEVTRQESTITRGIRETMVPGRGPRIDDIIEIKLTR